MTRSQLIDWLLDGDVSVQYQVHRDLLGDDKKELQDRIETEGWGKHFLSRRSSNGHWGMRFYLPKWISTHYTLLDLRNLNLSPKNRLAKATIDIVLDKSIANDGGIRLGPSTSDRSDVCVNGMFLNYASYFQVDEQRLSSIVDSILGERVPDGGFNCRTTRSGAIHSSLHTTLSVLEGIVEYQKTGYAYKAQELQKARKSAEEFILMHNLFLSDKTGEIIHKSFLNMPYPRRWKYDILSTLDYFQYADCAWNNRMTAAINSIQQKRNKRGTWNVQAAHPGQVHFVMEKAGKPSRWNTLRALRVLKHFKIDN